MTNLKILLTVVATLSVYTLVANLIPQVRSAVPEEIVLTADTSPEELVAIGEELFNGVGGCTACHGLGTRAPDLIGVVGTHCGTRVPGMSCKDYLWQSLTDPTAYVVEGFQPIMLDQSRLLSQAQLWALVAFLEDQGGTVDVTADDFASALAADAAPPPPPPADGEGGVVDVRQVIEANACLACHSLGGVGQQLAPPFESLAGKDADYIRRAILDPNADIAPGYEQFAGTMPPTFGQLLSDAQVDALVEFLQNGAGSGAGGGDAGGDGSEGGGE